jgi:mono/diheme cytochrome c family protein
MPRLKMSGRGPWRAPAMALWLIMALPVCAPDAASGPHRSHNHAPVPPEYAGKAPPGSIWTNPTILAQGHILYAQHCLACHGERGDGQGPAAPDLPLKPPDFRDPAMMRDLAPDYWLWRVMEGGQAVEPFRSRGSSMPPWKGELREVDAWAILAYVRQAFRPQAPGPRASPSASGSRAR